MAHQTTKRPSDQTTKVCAIGDGLFESRGGPPKVFEAEKTWGQKRFHHETTAKRKICLGRVDPSKFGVKIPRIDEDICKRRYRSALWRGRLAVLVVWSFGGPFLKRHRLTRSCRYKSSNKSCSSMRQCCFINGTSNDQTPKRPDDQSVRHW